MDGRARLPPSQIGLVGISPSHVNLTQLKQPIHQTKLDETLCVSPALSYFLGFYFSGKIIQYGDDSELIKPDYEVRHLYDWQRFKNKFKWPVKLEHTVTINGIDFVHIYKVVTKE